jgi:hypothetical protein
VARADLRFSQVRLLVDDFGEAFRFQQIPMTE